jgi:hypothetical protein
VTVPLPVPEVPALTVTKAELLAAVRRTCRQSTP